MSKTIVSVERVNAVEAHPNADRLEVIRVLGYQVVTQKGNYKVGDLAVYFPPDILIPLDAAEELGVAKYLKHAIFPGEEVQTQCRVGATRLRGKPSHGFCTPTTHDCRIPAGTPLGTNVSDYYNAHKYDPPVRLGAGDAASPLEAFHGYTSIENVQRYTDAFQETDQVVITEKLHGVNCRLGLIRDPSGEYQFCAGSHNVRRKEGGLYWHFMQEQVLHMLTSLVAGRDGEPCHNAIIFGEIFGPGIQDLDYGRSEKSFRVFDISIDGEYMNYWDMVKHCDAHRLRCVPHLYTGAYSADVVEHHTYGDTTFDDTKSTFKGREGCVVRPIHEAYSDILGGRLIVKSVSADYRDRKGAKDTGE